MHKTIPFLLCIVIFTQFPIEKNSATKEKERECVSEVYMVYSRCQRSQE